MPRSWWWPEIPATWHGASVYLSLNLGTNNGVNRPANVLLAWLIQPKSTAGCFTKVAVTQKNIVVTCNYVARLGNRFTSAGSAVCLVTCKLHGCFWNILHTAACSGILFSATAYSIMLFRRCSLQSSKVQLYSGTYISSDRSIPK